MPCLESIKPWVVPIVIWQRPIYQHTTWPTKLIFHQREKLHVYQSTLVLKGNFGVEAKICSYCQHVGDEHKHCPFVDDKLRQLLKDEGMNVHQPIIPTTTTKLPNIPMQGTQAMHLNFSHIAILVSYQLAWQPLY